MTVDDDLGVFTAAADNQVCDCDGHVMSVADCEIASGRADGPDAEGRARRRAPHLLPVVPAGRRSPGGDPPSPCRVERVATLDVCSHGDVEGPTTNGGVQVIEFAPGDVARDDLGGRYVVATEPDADGWVCVRNAQGRYSLVRPEAEGFTLIGGEG